MQTKPKSSALSHLDDVLYAYCFHACDMMSAWLPYPITAVAKNLEISLYAARKCVKELERQGLVARTCVAANREGDGSLPYNGFQLTREGYKTDAYRRAAHREAEICVKCFGGDIEEYLKVFL